jgi:hypothetical protein
MDRLGTRAILACALASAACSSSGVDPAPHGGTGAGAGAGAGAGGGGGATADRACAIPEGASEAIQAAVPAEGLSCTRYPWPLASPRDVIESSAGRIFVTEFGAGRIVELSEGGFVTIAEGLVAPIGLAEEAGGALLVAEELANTLARIDPLTGARVEIAQNLHAVTYVSLGPDGAAYVSSFQELADTDKGIVHRVDTGTGAAQPFATGLDVPEGSFFDAAGSLFVAEWLSPSGIYRFPAGGGAAELVAGGFEAVYGVAGDGDGGLFAGDHAGRVVHVAKDGGRRDIVTGIGRPGGIRRAKNGDLLIAEFVDFGQTGYLVRISGL